MITANNTSLPEIANGAAELCDAQQVEEIAIAMQKMEEDIEYRESLIAKGLERAKDFSWDKSAARFWEIVTNLSSR